jgi:uncharacterized protein YndB with AHSA1/START domain
MADIHHEIKIRSTPDEVFRALTTTDGLKSWHTAHVEGDGSVGNVWKLEFTGRPTFLWEVTEHIPPKRVAWKCVEGPGDSGRTSASFDLSSMEDGRTLVEFVHSGWPGTHGNYRKCNTYWGILLHHLKQYVETGASSPFFS